MSHMTEPRCLIEAKLASDHFRTASRRLENGFVGPPPKQHRRRAALAPVR
jgi:hypothetical protein